MILLVFSFRRNSESGVEARQESIWILGFGLVFPAVILGALLAYGLVIGAQLSPQNGANAVKVTAEARRWEWRFTYADAPALETTGTLHIPAGRPVDIAITTADVIHSFWVPRLAGKLDAIPGHINTLRLEADMPGTYKGVSAEFSGAGYEAFTFRVIAHTEAGWTKFLQGQPE
ncbi:QoxB, Quinol oxidase subunit II [Amylibacter cionae]|uniref:QoxB, Quinol oxidase subunit II n=2 Tax=Neptunicoccus cionae TaxID=2035344 RepID=A0A916R090_9RHOB|nr:QoxB, Quinol oxidase subunit II [Amylibacter cionae]